MFVTRLPLLYLVMPRQFKRNAVKEAPEQKTEGWHVRPCYRVEGSIVHIGFSALLDFGHPVPSTHCVPFQLCIVCALLRQAHSRVWHPLCSSIRWFSRCDRIADRNTPGNSEVRPFSPSWQRAVESSSHHGRQEAERGQEGLPVGYAPQRHSWQPTSSNRAPLLVQLPAPTVDT